MKYASIYVLCKLADNNIQKQKLSMGHEATSTHTPLTPLPACIIRCKDRDVASLYMYIACCG